MNRAAWSFVTYTCGHSVPVREGDRDIATPCRDCQPATGQGRKLRGTMDQHLVDYTVRNITTGDEEDIRVLELTPDEMLGFPDPVRETVIALIDDAQQTGSHWEANQDRILDLLLPFISDAQLYERDYAKWERKVLGDTEPPILDRYPPEHVSYRVRQLLNEAIDAAIENWQEGYWAEFTEETTVGEVWGNLAGFIESYIELDPDELSVAFMPRVEA